MKIGITGHTAGLGQAIAERLSLDGHEIAGFSLENGYDIRLNEDFPRIIEECRDCGAFVNCAFDRSRNSMQQAGLLVHLFDAWQDQPRHIVNIGSNAPDTYTHGPLTASKYRAAKAALDAMVLELNSLGKPCRVSIVRPNWIEGQAAAMREQATGDRLPKLHPEEVAGVVAMILERGPDITITSITLGRTLHRASEASEGPAPRFKRWLWRR